eukprot:g5757.t1
MCDYTPPECAAVLDLHPTNYSATGDQDYVWALPRLRASFACVDEQSGVVRLEAAIGTMPGGTDIKDFEVIADPQTTLVELEGSKDPRKAFKELTRYHVTIRAINDAKLITEISSDGIMIDSSPPVCYPPLLADGPPSAPDIQFQNYSDRVWAQWNGGMWDLQSFLERYEARFVGPSGERGDFTDLGFREEHLWSGLSLSHGDRVRTEIRMTNLAGLDNTCLTSGVTVDLTRPLSGTVALGNELMNNWKEICVPSDWNCVEGDLEWQWHDGAMFPRWEGFHDPESGISAYSVAIEHSSGRVVAALRNVADGEATGAAIMAKLRHRQRYRALVQATNGAGSPSKTLVASRYVTVDATPPVISYVSDLRANPADDVDLVTTTNVSLSVHWAKPTDRESGIKKCFWAIGSYEGGDDVSPWQECERGAQSGFAPAGTRIADGFRFFGTVICYNNAGGYTRKSSDGFVVDMSPPVAGNVLDGADDRADVDFVSSLTSAAGTWYAFYDLGSGIARYEVGLGTAANLTDVRAFEDAGLVGSYTFDFLDLEPLVRYYFVVRAVDAAGHVSETASSNGFIVDNTPPVAGNVSDGLTADDREWVATTDRLLGSWTGFNDPESGILQYEVGAGTPTNATYRPFRLVFDATQATIGGLELANGKYFIKVRATNRAGLRSVAVSNGIRVDSTPPACRLVADGLRIERDVEYQSSLSDLSSAWECVDHESQISSVKHCIGTSPGACDVRALVPLAPDASSVTVSSLRLQTGTTYFSSVRVENTVGLFITASTDGVTVDATPPVASFVVEGEGARADVSVSKVTTSVLASWHFEDSETIVDRYRVGLASDPGMATHPDVVAFRPVGRNQTARLVLPGSNTLKSGRTYFVVVEATNSLNLSSTAASNGVTIDTSPPTCLFVNDGTSHGHDAAFAFAATTVHANFKCVDAQSSVVRYKLSAYSSAATPHLLGSATFSGRAGQGSLSVPDLVDGQHVHFALEATNAVGLTSSMNSSGFTVDRSPPQAGEVVVWDGRHDNARSVQYQSARDHMFIKWRGFTDAGSGIHNYSYGVRGMSGLFARPERLLGGLQRSVRIDGLDLDGGGTYEVVVRAFDGVGMYSESVSPTVLIDPSPPLLTGQPVMLFLNYPLLAFEGRANATVMWPSAFQDAESGVANYTVSLLVDGHLVAVEQSRPRFESHMFFDFPVRNGSAVEARVSATNRAGMLTHTATKAKTVDLTRLIAGVVIDESLSACSVEKDTEFSSSTTSIKFSWHGFVDPTGRQLNYEWALGRSTTDTSVLPFASERQPPWINSSFVGDGALDAQSTSVVRLEGLNLSSGKYYVHVRATNHREVVTAVSNGFVIDSTPPELSVGFGRGGVHSGVGPLVHVSWAATDGGSDVKNCELALGRAPWASDVVPYSPVVCPNGNRTSASFNTSLQHGQSVFATLRATNFAGLSSERTTMRGAVIDGTAPIPGIVRNGRRVGGTPLPEPVSVSSVTNISANWAGFVDPESGVAEYFVCVGSTAFGHDIARCRSVGKREEATMTDITPTKPDINTVFVTVKASNGRGMITQACGAGMVLDHTDPEPGQIRIVGTREHGNTTFYGSEHTLTAELPPAALLQIGAVCTTQKAECAA